jgi:DNA-directed RNA polymerase specialized sigma24 family protein
MVIEYMIKYKKNLIELEGSIPQKLYDRLEVRKLRAIEEDQQIRVITIENLLPVISNQEYARILDAIKPHLRTKVSLIKIMGRKYDEISEETNKVVEKVLRE